MELFYLISLGKLHSRILNFSRLKFFRLLPPLNFALLQFSAIVLAGCLNGARMRNCWPTNFQYSPYYCPEKNAKSAAAAQTFHSHCSIHSFRIKFRPKAKKLIAVFSGA